MGIFSDFVDAFKSMVRETINGLAEGINGIFGSPKVAALFFFVLTVVIFATSGYYVDLWEQPWTFFLKHSSLMGFAIGTAVALVAAYIPSIQYSLGYVMGIMTFFLLLTGYMGWLTPMMHALIESSAVVTAIYVSVGVASAIIFTTMLAAGPNSDFIEGFIDGMFAVPDAVADAVDAAFPNLGWYVLLGLGAILLTRGGTSNARIRFEKSG